MSIETKETDSQRRWRFRANDLVTMLAVIAVLLAGFALYLALTDDDGGGSGEVAVGDEVTIERAEAILDRAQDASDSASNLLSFLETGSAVVALILGVGAFMLRRSILEQVEQAQELSRSTEARFLARDEALARREERLGQLQERLEQRLDDMDRQIEERSADIQQQVRNSFRVVSLQLLAEQQSRERNTATAIDTLQRAHELDPDNQATNYLLGYLYMAVKELDRAIAHLQRALELEPDFTPAIAAMGLALRRKGDAMEGRGLIAERDRYWGEALARLQQALSKDEKLTDAEGESYYGTLGGLYRRQGRLFAALDAYERAHKVTPKSSYPIINLAALHTHHGNHERARYYFEQVVKQALLQLDDDPRDTWTRCDLAQARLVLGEVDEAMNELQVVIDQNPEQVVLETVYSGLKFLGGSPRPIEGLDSMMVVLEEELARRAAAKQAQEEQAAADAS